jgi:hypothetical protein
MFNLSNTAVVLLVFLMLSGIFGCASKSVVLYNGYPVPKEFNIAWSPDKSIEARWSFVGWYPKEIESKGFVEVIERPQYLIGDQVNTLDSHVKWVAVNLQINNPLRKKYRLTKVVTIGKDAQEASLGDWTIREINTLVVTGPITPDREISLAVHLIAEEADGTPAPVLCIGELRYLVRASHSALSGEEQKGGDDRG